MWRAPDRLLEGVKLCPDFCTQGLAVEPLQEAFADQPGQGLKRLKQQWRLGQVQVQPEVHTPRFEAPQQLAPARPGIAADHATDRLHMPHRREPQRSLVDAGMQAEVVHHDADGTSAAMLRRTMRKRVFSHARRPGHVLQRGRVRWFIAVGSAAAAVHWLVVVTLVGGRDWRPLVANVLGWLLAFTVSFAGHHRLTFGGHGAPLRSSALRFFAVSAGGFVVNETAYAVLLGWGVRRYDLALAVVLIGVAGVTYLLSRHWAFLRNERS